MLPGSRVQAVLIAKFKECIGWVLCGSGCGAGFDSRHMSAVVDGIFLRLCPNVRPRGSSRVPEFLVLVLLHQNMSNSAGSVIAFV